MNFWGVLFETLLNTTDNGSNVVIDTKIKRVRERQREMHMSHQVWNFSQALRHSILTELLAIVK